MVKQNSFSTIIAALKRLKLSYQGVHRGCRKL